MNRVRKFVHADPMSRIYPLNLAQLPRFGQDIDIIYTDGKSDRLWDGIPLEAAGVVVRANALADKQLFEGIVAIDLRACLPPTSRTSLSISLHGPPVLRTTPKKVDFNAYRLSVFETVAHEYFHLVQAWIVETRHRNPDAFERAYAREHWRAIGSITSEDLLWLLQPDRLRARAWARNRFESSAKRMAEAAKHRLRGEVDRGLWDAVFPIPEMHEIVRQAQAAGLHAL